MKNLNKVLETFSNDLESSNKKLERLEDSFNKSGINPLDNAGYNELRGLIKGIEKCITICSDLIIFKEKDDLKDEGGVVIL